MEAVAAFGAFQFQGSRLSSSFAFVRPETMRSKTSVNHAIGSTPCSFAVLISVIAIAQWRAPPSLPAVLGRSAAAISAAVADQGDLARYVGRQGARLAGSATEVSLLCWLGVRSRTRFGFGIVSAK